MKKKILKAGIALLIIISLVFAYFWHLGYRGRPIARDHVELFEKAMNSYGESILYDMTERTEESVVFTLGQTPRGIEGYEFIPYNLHVDNHSANFEVSFKTGGSFTFPVSTDELKNLGWTYVNDDINWYVNSKDEYIHYSSITENIFSLELETVPGVESYSEADEVYRDRPDFTVCNSINSNSNLSDILELGNPHEIRFYKNQPPRYCFYYNRHYPRNMKPMEYKNGPVIEIEYIVIDDGKYSGYITFAIDAEKNRLLGVNLVSW